MTKVFTTEITSENIPSDNPIHQRLLRPYVLVKDWIRGDVLEVGCGEGRGIDLLMEKAKSYTAIDKIEPVVKKLQEKYPSGKFLSGNIPPLTSFADNSFDCVISFQVIEHIEDDHLFLKEINRVLRQGGTAWITTPNRPLSLSRNPWHVREYTSSELTDLAKKYFAQVEMKGIAGNEKIMQYYDRNKKSVDRMMRWDFLDLQHKLPASVLRIPYEMMNRMNRNKLKGQADELVTSIKQDDYIFSANAEKALDLFLIVRK
jgi:ubiquinone/menaquinone biosynthesis C-methylase UbiE